VRLLSGCCCRLLDYKAALPHAQRRLILEQQLHAPRSLEHAHALEELCMVQRGLKDFPASRKAIAEALAIMDELGLQQSEEYGGMLVTLGSLDLDQGHLKEALVIYGKAKAVLVQHKGHEYGPLLDNMASCHKELQQWNEAIACRKEVVEHNRNLLGTSHPDYASVLNNLATLFFSLKQYEEAIPRFEEALPICQRVFGDQHPITVGVASSLAIARQRAKQPHRGMIKVGHDHRMCNQCGKVVEHTSECSGCARVWYCDTDCQLKHWATHKPLCNVCLQCDTVQTVNRYCSRCKKAKYCNATCQTAHWSQHKSECVAPQ
jgi:tetratricopeptide (TPR) repeat protein